MMMNFKFGIKYNAKLDSAKIGPLFGPELWKLLKDGRTIGFLARHILSATFADMVSLHDDTGYSLMIDGSFVQTRVVTKLGCNLLRSKMKGIGRSEDTADQIDWENHLKGWVFIDNRQSPVLTIVVTYSVPRDRSSLSIREWDSLISLMPERNICW